MINGEKTEREIEMEAYFETVKGKFKIFVQNQGESETTDEELSVQTSFTEIDRALHKVKLDIITNAKLGLRKPIQVFVRRIIEK